MSKQKTLKAAFGFGTMDALLKTPKTLGLSEDEAVDILGRYETVKGLKGDQIVLTAKRYRTDTDFVYMSIRLTREVWVAAKAKYFSVVEDTDDYKIYSVSKDVEVVFDDGEGFASERDFDKALDDAYGKDDKDDGDDDGKDDGDDDGNDDGNDDGDDKDGYEIVDEHNEPEKKVQRPPQVGDLITKDGEKLKLSKMNVPSSKDKSVIGSQAVVMESENKDRIGKTYFFRAFAGKNIESDYILGGRGGKTWFPKAAKLVKADDVTVKKYKYLVVMIEGTPVLVEMKGIAASGYAYTCTVSGTSKVIEVNAALVEKSAKLRVPLIS